MSADATLSRIGTILADMAVFEAVLPRPRTPAEIDASLDRIVAETRGPRRAIAIEKEVAE